MSGIISRFEQLHGHLTEIINVISGSSAQNIDSNLAATLQGSLTTLKSLQGRTTNSVNSVDWAATSGKDQYTVVKAINVIEGKLENLEVLLQSQTTKAIHIEFAVQAVADNFLEIDRIIQLELAQHKK